MAKSLTSLLIIIILNSIMKKLLPLLLIGCAVLSFAKTKIPVMQKASVHKGTTTEQTQQQEYQPLLGTVSNSQADKNDILANTYQLRVITKYMPDGSVEMGTATAFRLHKNWFLTCAHGPFQQMNTKNKPVLTLGVSVKERANAPGHSAPFSLVVDMTVTGKDANGKVFLFNPTLKLNSTNTGRGEDLALIYVPSADPSKPTFEKVNQQFQQIETQLGSLKDTIPGEMLDGAKSKLLSAQKKESSLWKRFINHPIKPFHLFILSEQTLIPELGFPGVTPYSFPLTAYYIHEANRGVVTFNFVPQGTHKGTNAIFYERVTDLIPGTSGSPMTYGNYVVSVDSARNCSPMLTDKFYNWLKETMGKDYVKGMCVTTNPPPENAVMTPVHSRTTSDRNQG